VSDYGYGEDDPIDRLLAIGNGEASPEPIRQALLEEPADLWTAIRGERPARDPVPGSFDLILRGKAQMFFGERGSGKSITIATLMVSMAAAGERVLYLDRENGEAVAGEWIRDILDAHPEWAERVDDINLVGKHYPVLRESWTPDAVADALEGFSVVALDSVREFIGQLKGSNNSDDDVTRLLNLIVTPLVSRGAAVIVADNVGHEHTHRPKGAGGKMDGVPQIYHVVCTTPFTPDETGAVEITCTRSRVGDRDRKWTAVFGGGTYEVRALGSLSAIGREEFRVAAVRVLRAAGATLSANAAIAGVRDLGVRVRKTTALDWLRELAADVASGIEADGAGYRSAPEARFPNPPMILKVEGGSHGGGSQDPLVVGHSVIGQIKDR
jgi:hypothetical protein